MEGAERDPLRMGTLEGAERRGEDMGTLKGAKGTLSTGHLKGWVMEALKVRRASSGGKGC